MRQTEFIYQEGDVMSERAVKHVRRTLGDRLRNLRKERGLSQQRLGQRSGLSGKFIGEVERGEKSVSVDSLYHVSVALDIPLRDLTDMGPTRRSKGTNPEVEKLLALLSGPRKPEQVRRAYEVLRAMFGSSR
jgi:XRE family transcriptional regulator, regulator of sulfur utilization